MTNATREGTDVWTQFTFLPSELPHYAGCIIALFEGSGLEGKVLRNAFESLSNILMRDHIQAGGKNIYISEKRPKSPRPT
jgi:hypothetical protein